MTTPFYRTNQRVLSTAGMLLALLLPIPNAIADATLPGECPFPEGVTATSDGALFVGSMQYGAIYRIAPGEMEGKPFVPDNVNGLVATLGLFADEQRGRLIACSADPGIASVLVGDDRFDGKGGSGIRLFDLSTGEPTGSADFPGGGFCNDIAVDADGIVYATDTYNGRVIRYDGEAVSVWAMGGIMANQPWTLNGIDYRASENALYVGSQATGEIFRIGISEGGAPQAVEAINLSRPLEVPDGIRFIDDNTLGVIEAGSGRYSTVNLDDGQVTSVAENLASPATFAIARGKAWITSTQGGEFWSAEGSCAKAQRPFRLIEIPAP